MENEDKLTFYKTHPKSCRPDDFWGQVMRTVNGVPVGEDQIALIEAAIIRALQLSANDVLLDLCCGNGALTDRIFAVCNGGLGVDFSEPLLETANRYFRSAPQRLYLLGDVGQFVATTDDTSRFTRCLCYGSFMFLPQDKAHRILRDVHDRFPTIDRFFIGNLPDRAKMDVFLADRGQDRLSHDDPASPIGIWRSEAEFAGLARDGGWQVQFSRMPDTFYGASYRYDALLYKDRVRP